PAALGVTFVTPSRRRGGRFYSLSICRQPFSSVADFSFAAFPEKRCEGGVVYPGAPRVSTVSETFWVGVAPRTLTVASRTRREGLFLQRPAGVAAGAGVALRWPMQQPTDPTHPYRAAPPVGASVRRRRYVALLGVAAALSTYVLYRAGRPRAVVTLAAQAAPAHPSVSLLEQELPPSTPLAPLLAADGAGSPALSLPEEGTTRVLRGRRLTLTFNRLMVASERVGELATTPVATFAPPVPGTFRWATRSSVSFEPAASVWAREVDALLTLDPALRSLAGEAIQVEGLRRAVFDGAARVDPDATVTRIPTGAPIAIGTTRDIAPAELAREMMVYEIGAAGRSIAFSLQRRAVDAEGRARFDLRLARVMDPGARVGVAFAPSRWPSLYPSNQLPNLEVEFEPPPRIEGVACPAEGGSDDADEEGGCEHESVPGEIVDVATVLRLRASSALGAVDRSMVQVSPAVAGLTVRSVRRSLEITAEWVPDQVYEVRIAGLRDAQGAALRGLAPLAVRSRGLPPELRLHEGLLTLERAAEMVVPVAGVHVAEGVVWLRDVAAGDEALAVSQRFSRTALAEASRWRSSALGAVLPDARANRWAAGRLRWSDDDRDGAMRVVEVTADRVVGGASTRALVQRTDLGLHGQALRDGVLVWVTSIGRATPIEGADLRVTGADGRVLRARTDGSGLAWIARPGAVSADESLIVQASRAGDRAVMVLDPRRTVRPGGLGLSEGVAAAPTAAGGVLAMVYTDRGVVRPGERMHAVGVLRRRRADGLRAVSNRAAEFELVGPDGTVATARRRSSRFGSMTVDFDVPRTARPGPYSVLLREPLADRATLASAAIQVADHQPPRVRADLVLPGVTVGDGDSLRARLEARLLIGAPLRDAPVRWSVAREGKAPDPVGHGGYVFGLADASTYPPVAGSAASNTDATGVAPAEILLRSAYPQRERLRVEARVRDATGGETSASRVLTLLPADVEVGLRALPPFVEMNTDVNPAAIVVRADGGAAPGQSVRVTIHREGWRAWWERDEGDAATAEPASFVARRVQQRTEERACTLR
ncbi:MAG: hypothetical protein JWM10_4782, partial [Myxococcaceae bacterium]|nr:hypothetical protein [Myxococcaceae bacterium]